MKKLFLMAAAAATVLATGCMKNNNDDSDQTRIVVRLNGASIVPETRAVEAPAQETDGQSPVTLNKAWVYVISSEGVYNEQMNITEAQDGGYVIGGAEKLFPADSKVYVLGNWPTGVTPADLDSWQEIQETVVDISSTTSYTTPALANATGAPVGVTVSTENDKLATVDIEISPLFSRLELWKITGGKHIMSFNVAGVYINKYFPAFSLSGAGAGEQKVYAAGTTVFNGWGDATGWASSTNGVKTGNDVQPRVFAEAATGASNVWAYNVGAGPQVGFIIKLTDIVYYPEIDGQPGIFGPTTTTIDEKLLIVNSYSNLGTSPFARGTIYRVKNIEFDYTDLVDDITGVSITANVDVLNWNVTDLTPTLGE